MQLLMFCENANQVHLCHNLVSSEFFPSYVDPEVLLLDWDKETVEWVVGAVADIGWEVSVTNVFDAVSSAFRKAVTTASTAKDRKAGLVDLGFEYLKRYFGRSDVLLIQFNDASVRGSSIAAVCRNTGLRRLLIQDGFLNFVSKTSNLRATDQNYGWGGSQPELVAVWGQAMKDALVGRHSSNPSSIRVTGPTKQEIVVPAVADHKPVEGEILKVLWADQAIIDQKKATEKDWLAEFADIAEQLSDFHTTLRLHPSTKEKSRLALKKRLGVAVKVMTTGSPKIGQDELRAYDVVVTYYSTVFLDCLANNIPCVIYKTRTLDIELPQIDHPLLTYCSTAEGLRDAVLSAAQTDVNGEAPPDIFNYVAPDDGAALVSRIVAEALPPRGEEKAGIQPIVRDIEIYSGLRRLLGKRVLVIGGSFGNHIGVGKPIKVFVEYLRGLDVEIEFHLATNGGRENLLRKVSEASLVVINSFDVVRILRESDLRDLTSICEMRSVPIVFYCHETQFVYSRLLAKAGGKIDAFIKHTLPRSHVFAVSDRQADWLGSLGCKSVRTVYNSVGSKFVPSEKGEHEDGSAVVLMVGTQQRRKGVDLFSHVADLARERGLNWRFVWLGAHTKAAEGCYKSNAVEWVGHVSAEEVSHWLAKTSVFFLSSIDDPLPLGVGEALMCGIPSVVYSATGFADFITLHKAGEVFNVYEPHVALDKLRVVIGDVDGYSVAPELVRDIIGVEAFGKRMLVSLGEIMAGSAPEYAYARHISGPTGPKWAILYYLEENLPASLVKRGERVLKRLGVI